MPQSTVKLLRALPPLQNLKHYSKGKCPQIEGVFGYSRALIGASWVNKTGWRGIIDMDKDLGLLKNDFNRCLKVLW